MSLFFGDKGVLTMAMACHRCQPASYCFIVVYSVKPIPLAFCYECEDKEAFTLVQKMDEDETPLEQILSYLNARSPNGRAA